MISGFEKMDVWKLSHHLALALYRLSEQFPRHERYGFTAQLRRAALAIPTNIAEGNARHYRKEYLQFCNIARGSLGELRYFLRFIYDLGWIDSERYREFVAEYGRVGQMINGLMTTLRGHHPGKKSAHA